MSKKIDEELLYKSIADLYKNDFIFNQIIPKDFFDKCVTYKEKVEKILTNMACRDFSYAVNSVMGWEVVEFGNDCVDDENKYWFHTVCKISDTNLYFDIKGVRTEEGILSEYANVNDSIYIVDVDPSVDYIDTNEIMETFVNFLINRNYPSNKSKSKFKL